MAVDDGTWMDRWLRSDGDEVLLPTNGREVYARQDGWTLLEERAYDYRQQMAADGAASQWRGTREDTVLMPSGPTAYFPADVVLPSIEDELTLLPPSSAPSLRS